MTFLPHTHRGMASAPKRWHLARQAEGRTSMGTWNTGTLDNDTSLDSLGAFESRATLSRLFFTHSRG